MIEVKRDARSATLCVVGDLTAGAAESELLQLVKELVADGVQNLRVDFERAGFVDSSGLGVLVRSHTACAKVGGGIRLVNVSPQLTSLLRIARLDDVLAIGGEA